jgi:hypothetical protein
VREERGKEREDTLDLVAFSEQGILPRGQGVNLEYKGGWNKVKNVLRETGTLKPE